MSVYFPVQPINYNRVKRMNVDYAAVGQRIKDVRKARRLTQEQLAEALSVSVGHESYLHRELGQAVERMDGRQKRLLLDMARLILKY